MRLKCNKCGEEKSLEDFSPARNKKRGYQTHCKPCRAEYNKKHYRRNKQRYVDSRTKNRNKVLEELRYYKEANPCTDCGKYFPYYIMEFDHLHSKEVEISKIARNSSRVKLWKEIEKCELVCCLCHRFRTHKEKL